MNIWIIYYLSFITISDPQ